MRRATFAILCALAAALLGCGPPVAPKARVDDPPQRVTRQRISRPNTQQSPVTKGAPQRSPAPGAGRRR